MGSGPSLCPIHCTQSCFPSEQCANTALHPILSHDRITAAVPQPQPHPNPNTIPNHNPIPCPTPSLPIPIPVLSPTTTPFHVQPHPNPHPIPIPTPIKHSPHLFTLFSTVSFQRFTNEDHLAVHKHKHEMTLKFGPARTDSVIIAGSAQPRAALMPTAARLMLGSRCSEPRLCLP